MDAKSNENEHSVGSIRSAEMIDDPILQTLADHSKDELLDFIRRQREAGVRITFAGKNNARQIARQVQPRVVRRIAKYCVGSEDEQSRNLLVEGENLQAMATLYRDRGQVDLVLTDPPYNTGNDFRYNDRWDEDPNDPDLGELVPESDGGRHTKWMKFMWPRLQMPASIASATAMATIRTHWGRGVGGSSPSEVRVFVSCIGRPLPGAPVGA